MKMNCESAAARQMISLPASLSQDYWSFRPRRILARRPVKAFRPEAWEGIVWAALAVSAIWGLAASIGF